METQDVLLRLISILQNARSKPEMYFPHIAPEYIDAWVWGLRTGLGIVGLDWSNSDVTDAYRRRGVELSATTDQIKALAMHGLSSHAAAMALLDIETEAWQARLQRLSPA